MPDSQLSTSAQQFVQAYESGQTDAAAKALGPLKVRRGRIRSQTNRWHHNRADERSMILESGLSCKSWTVEPSWGRGRTRPGHSSYGHQFVTWIDCPGANSDSSSSHTQDPSSRRQLSIRSKSEMYLLSRGTMPC